MIKDFFEMTRNERRGAVAILLVIALLLALTCVARCRRSDTVPTGTDAVRLFEAEVDSSAVEFPKPASKSPKKPRKSNAKPAKKSPKPSPAPRRMDPVPQF